MATYGINARDAEGNTVDRLIRATTNKGAAEAAVAQFQLPASEGTLAVDAPSGTRTFYSVAEDGSVKATDRLNTGGHWTALS